MSTDGEETFVMIGKLVVVPMAIGLALLGTVFETWIALILWRWFAPWPMPLTLVQLVGLNLALTLIVRQSVHGPDTRSTGQQFKAMVEHIIGRPLLMLAAAWMLKFWL